MERAYRRAHLFPVRHHSPRASWVLRRWLDRVRPSLVLVEGPEDASHLIDPLVDPETVPPVAILGYRTDGTPKSGLWPFASYSPELVALSWAKKERVSSKFIDISTGQALSRDDTHEESGEPAEPEVEQISLSEEAAKRAGFRSFEELWEATFEAPDHDEASFRSAIVSYADLVRSEGRDRDVHRARDAFMARRIDEAAGSGVEPERIAVVLGAAHAAALAVGDVDDALLVMLEGIVPTTTTLVPFSFPRLAEQLGYGAGNRAPQFYQRAWDRDVSYRRAALEVLIDFSEHLRVRGFMVSLADTIEAYRLASMLAEIRGKAEPGLDEIREATIATMCRGDDTHVDGFLWSSVIGRSVGKVASKIGKNSLQEEFWREVDHRRLPRSDSSEEFVLKLGDHFQVETSVFLHRLRIADVPYANYRGTTSTAMRRGPSEEAAGGLAALTRVSEAWEAQWTPATDVALVERIVLGESLEHVSKRVLSERLSEARTTAEAAGVLLESVVASIPETISTALAACDRLAATDDDLPSLATACRALSGLVSYGSSRESSKHGRSAIPPLCIKTFDRAVLRVHGACSGNDEAVAPVKIALRILHEIAISQKIVDKSSWLEVARLLARDYSVNASASGLAAGLLYLAQELPESEATLLVEQRLSDTLEPERAAGFLEGFLEVNALVIVKSRAIVAALDAFLLAMEAERFRDALPVLRRAFSGLGKTERRYLVENLIALRSLASNAKDAARVIAERDKEKLASISEEISKAMDDLDDLL
jgi:hypothetical protein